MRLFRAFGEIAIEGLDSVNKKLAAFERVGFAIAERLNEIGEKAQEAGMRLSEGLTSPLAAAAGAVFLLNGRIAENYESLREASRQMGLTTRDLQALRLGFEGVLNADETDTLLGTLNSGINDFIATGGGALQTFFNDIARRYGVTAEQMARETPVEQLELLFRSVRRSSTSFEDFRAKLGAIGPEFAAMASEYWANGAGVFRDMAEQGANAPEAMSENLMRMLDQWEETSDRIGGSLQRLNNQFTEATMPVQTRLAELFETRVIPILERVIEYVDRAAQWFLNLDAGTQEVVAGVGILLGALGPALVIFGAIVKAVGVVVSAISAIAPLFAALAGPVGVAVAAFFAAKMLFEQFPGLLDAIVNAISWVAEAARNDFNRIVDAINWVIEGVKSAAQWIADAIPAAFDAVDNFFLNTLPRWLSMFGEWASDVVSDVLDFFSRLPAAIAAVFADMGRRALARIREMASGIGDTLAALYNRVVGNSIIPDMASEVVDELDGMADGSIAATVRMNSGMVEAMPREGLDANYSTATGTGSGNTTIDLRYSIFRDDNDMLQRMRVAGAEPIGAY